MILTLTRTVGLPSSANGIQPTANSFRLTDDGQRQTDEDFFIAYFSVAPFRNLNCAFTAPKMPQSRTPQELKTFFKTELTGSILYQFRTMPFAHCPLRSYALFMVLQNFEKPPASCNSIGMPFQAYYSMPQQLGRITSEGWMRTQIARSVEATKIIPTKRPFFWSYISQKLPNFPVETRSQKLKTFFKNELSGSILYQTVRFFQLQRAAHAFATTSLHYIPCPKQSDALSNAMPKCEARPFSS